MKTAFKKFLPLLVGLALLFWIAPASADTCAPVDLSATAACDAPGATYDANTLCLAQPIDRPGIGNIDEEFIGGSVTIAGRFRSPAQLQNLVDFAVSYDNATQPLLGAAGVFAPQIGSCDFQTFSDTGAFSYSFSLDYDGVYDIAIQARLAGDGGTFQDIEVSRRILRVAGPHLTVDGAQSAGSASAAGFEFSTEPPPDADGDGLPDWYEDRNRNGRVDRGETDPNHPDVNPDPSTHFADLIPPVGIPVATTNINLCVAPHVPGGDASHAPDLGGYEIAVLATNTVTDNGHSIVLNSSCDPNVPFQASPADRLCTPAPSGFCAGGYIISVPMANGTNSIELTVDKLVDGTSFGTTQKIEVAPIENDLKGPSLTIDFLKADGTVISNVDGQVLRPEEATEATIRITTGEDLPNIPSALCVDFQNQGDSTEVCPSSSDGRHFQVVMSSLRFPVNTFTVKAKDAAGNQTIETHAFAFGQVRSLFNADGHFSLAQSIVPKGIGAFLSAHYLQTEVKQALLNILNSRKFKDQMFLKLLDPQPPNDEEIQCLRDLEETLHHNCQFINHYAAEDKSWEVAIKGFCGPPGNNQDRPECANIGNFEIPSFQLLNNNRIRVQLKLTGSNGQPALGERAEMYTCRFKDTDGDGIPDVKDDDADNDGICDRPGTKDLHHICSRSLNDTATNGYCDHHPEIRDDCTLDQTVRAEDCKDVQLGDIRAEDYKGCSDQDDDGDHLLDNKDIPCEVLNDPDFNTHIIPLKFAIKELLLNLELQLTKDPDTGLIKVHIQPAPVSDEGGPRQLVEFESTDGGIIHFDCAKPSSELPNGEPSMSLEDPRRCGQRFCIDQDTCAGLSYLDTLLRGAGDSVENLMIAAGEGGVHLGPITVSAASIDPTHRANQSVDQQLWCTMQANLRCSVPARLNDTLDDFEVDLEHPEKTKKVSAISTKLLDKRFHFDLFAPIGSSDLSIDSTGVGLGAGGVILPAGVTDSNDEAERDATDFLNNLPTDFRNPKLGTVYETEAPVEDQMNPIEAAYNIGSEIGLALKEETVNSLLESVNLTLFDLNRTEAAVGDDKRTLDSDSRIMRITNGFGVPEIGGTACLDKNGADINPATGDPDSLDDWKCFPFSLDFNSTFGGSLLGYIDFNGDGRLDPETDSKFPILMRTELNPSLAPTVKFLRVSAADSFDGSAGGRPQVIDAELEIGVADLKMSLFEEQTEVGSDGTTRCKVDPATDRCKIKDWCDADRFPGMDPANCQPSDRRMRHKSPMFSFLISGKLTLMLEIDLSRPGLLSIHAGISSIDSPNGATLDPEKTYVTVTTLDNHTIVPDAQLAAQFTPKLREILGDYAYNGSRTINVRIPTMIPVLDTRQTFQSFCERYPEIHEVCKCLTQPDADGCQTIRDTDHNWEKLQLSQFGIFGLEIEEPVLGLSGSATYTDDSSEATGSLFGSPRYLDVGLGTCLKDHDGNCIGEPQTSTRRQGLRMEKKSNFPKFWSIIKSWGRSR